MNKRNGRGRKRRKHRFNRKKHCQTLSKKDCQHKVPNTCGISTDVENGAENNNRVLPQSAFSMLSNGNEGETGEISGTEDMQAHNTENKSDIEDDTYMSNEDTEGENEQICGTEERDIDSDDDSYISNDDSINQDGDMIVIGINKGSTVSSVDGSVSNLHGDDQIITRS